MNRLSILILLLLIHVTVFSQTPRARDYGIKIGVLLPGKLNSISDVPGVRVGHSTLIKDSHIRTGVTAIIPHAGNLFQEKIPAAIFTGNGFGKR